MITAINAGQIKEMLIAIADAVIEAKPLLTEVDSAVGDGDHGIGMEMGLRKAKEKLLATDPSDVYQLFAITGKTMLMSMGGASGVIFGSMFLAGAKGKAPASEITTPKLAEMFRAAAEEIHRRGGASIGDKTMVDAFFPAVTALEENANNGLSAAFTAAAAAAHVGMESTKNYEAKFGRSKTQASTLGFMDAGAVSVWVIFDAACKYIRSIDV